VEGPWSRGVRGAVGMRLSSVVLAAAAAVFDNNALCYVYIYIRMNVTSLRVGRRTRSRRVWLKRASE